VVKVVPLENFAIAALNKAFPTRRVVFFGVYTFRASQSSDFNWDLRFSLVLLRATKERPMAPAPPRRSTGR
jgi:hypothetical protein